MNGRDCYMDPPEEPGEYNVAVAGVRTFLPLWWKFDPEKGWRITGTSFVTELKEGTARWYPNKNASTSTPD